MIFAASVGQWLNWLGHFHPVIVHLPIGILIVGLVLELPVVKKRLATPPDRAVEIILAAGGISAVVACVLGWMLSNGGSYDENSVALHQWMGIAVAMIAGTCWSMKKKYNHGGNKSPYYGPLLIFLFVAILLTGHWGGGLTHGEDYLTASFFESGSRPGTDSLKPARKIPENIPDALLYADIVQPVLADKCYDCHSKKKIKGGLRMDDERLLFKGGKHGVILQPGNAEESELIQRLLLPEEDDKRMPPKKQAPVTASEIALLTWWVKNGADIKRKVRDFEDTAALMEILNPSASAKKKETREPEALSNIFSKELPAVNNEHIRALTALGVIVAPINQQSTLLDISFINYPDFSDNQMHLLTQLAPNIVSLKMDHTAISDAAVKELAKFANLVRLNLAYTNISDAGVLRLKDLPALEYLNLVHTGITDQAIIELTSLQTLKKIYCWHTSVTGNTIKKVNADKKIVEAEAQITD